jgi:elongation factor P--beta-lysine ligase
MKKVTNPKLQSFIIREKVIQAVRAFFDEQEFHEVMTPSMNAALPVEPNVYAFETEWLTASETKKMYLSTSPEAGLKKMMAEGIGNCYAIGKCFRNLEGAGSTHQPEFLMLEWYRENSDYAKIMDDVEDLFRFVKKRVDAHLHVEHSLQFEYESKQIDLAPHWPRFSLTELLRKHASMEMEDIVREGRLEEVATQKGYQTFGATWSQLFDQIFLNEVEPHFTAQPFFLTDFPARLSPLCKVNTAKPYLAERFECFVAGIELGNGNNEGTDVQTIRTAFEKEKAQREKNNQGAPPIDEGFLTALKKLAGEQWAGIGLGIDRLAMIMAGESSIEKFL